MLSACPQMRMCLDRARESLLLPSADHGKTPRKFVSAVLLGGGGGAWDGPCSAIIERRIDEILCVEAAGHYGGQIGLLIKA